MADTTWANAYHNYLVDGKLCMEIVLGAPQRHDAFFLVAHAVSPGDPMPLISGRFFDRNGSFLLRVEKNALAENPNGFSMLETQNGWSLMDTALEALLSIEVLDFENGHVSILRGNLYDQDGRLVALGDDEGLHRTETPVPG